MCPFANRSSLSSPSASGALALLQRLPLSFPHIRPELVTFSIYLVDSMYVAWYIILLNTPGGKCEIDWLLAQDFAVAVLFINVRWDTSAVLCKSILLEESSQAAECYNSCLSNPAARWSVPRRIQICSSDAWPCFGNGGFAPFYK